MVFAFLIESVVELLKPVWYRLEGLGNILGVEIAYLASLVLSIAGAIAFDVNALPLFGIEGSGVVGQVLTGLLASGGSNYVHNRLRHVSEVTIEKVFVPEDEESEGKG